MQKKLDANARPPTLLRVNRNPVKLTALLYLRDALGAERYEDCAELIAVAREFGAVEREIEELLEDARRTPTCAVLGRLPHVVSGRSR